MNYDKLREEYWEFKETQYYGSTDPVVMALCDKAGWEAFKARAIMDKLEFVKQDTIQDLIKERDGYKQNSEGFIKHADSLKRKILELQQEMASLREFYSKVPSEASLIK